jgi:hypothetical protein
MRENCFSFADSDKRTISEHKYVLHTHNRFKNPSVKFESRYYVHTYVHSMKVHVKGIFSTPTRYVYYDEGKWFKFCRTSDDEMSPKPSSQASQMKTKTCFFRSGHFYIISFTF